MVELVVSETSMGGRQHPLPIHLVEQGGIVRICAAMIYGGVLCSPAMREAMRERLQCQWASFLASVPSPKRETLPREIVFVTPEENDVSHDHDHHSHQQQLDGDVRVVPDKKRAATAAAVSSAGGKHQQAKKHSSKPPPRDTTIGIQLWAETDTGAMLSGNALQQGKSADAFDLDTLVQESLSSLVLCIRSGACFDEHTADQMLVYMALADGVSTISCCPRTAASSLHIETAMKILSDVTGVVFSMNVNSDTECRVIACAGINSVISK